MSKRKDSEKVERRAIRRLDRVVQGYELDIQVLAAQNKILRESILRLQEAVSTNEGRMGDIIDELKELQSLKQKADIDLRKRVEEISE